MEYNLITNIGSCYIEIPSLLYYSHIPTAVISLLVGFMVFLKSKDLSSRILLAISIIFSSWLVCNLITWISVDSRLIMFVWSMMGVLTSLIFISSFYFAYVYIKKDDLSFNTKGVIFLLLSPVIFLMPFYLKSFNAVDCEAVDNIKYVYYYNGLSLIILVWILFVAFFQYKKVEEIFKKQIIYLVAGIELFLFSYFVTGFLGSYLDNKGVPYAFEIDQYGLFGMTFFMGAIAFLIVKYNAFEIKLLGAQALVVSLVLLIGSQFFFIENDTNKILTGITLALSVGFGYFLIKSVKKEAERKEQLQLMADKLATANDSLRKLDNAKTEFISIASHQLRTPITAIKGFSSLLLEGSYGEVSESVHSALEKVYSSAERLVNLVEDLLNVSRIESGRMQFSFEKGSVEKLIKELYDNFILIAKNKKFYLDIKLPENPLPEIVMDYSKIRELVSNFIDNALKYTEKGGATVKAELREDGVVIDENGFVIVGKKSEFGKMIRITVSDTGIGIPKEEIPYLFKKFSRGKDVSRLHVGGTGLGLYVGKAIAETHHGQVWVESDGAGLGSRFIIEIPVEHVG
ncbi:MAG: PAS/PAC sensor signal transduction histidine kinase [Parcubacteria group bacterium GW2011_GWD2_38_11]|nr:MAG: PAS/PAC sensor signal transduction histidine kinase [Parcubacteria group bacterium GW2011_GWD2_38_11]